jgi:pimeloyl-ACP methyl ester carboxylesterase
MSSGRRDGRNHGQEVRHALSKEASMGQYMQVNVVRTWYEERGEGDPTVLLHGGFSDGRSFAGNLDRLADRFRLFVPDRRGHGRTPDVEGPLTVDLMAGDMTAFLEQVVGGPAHLVGYSSGAEVALQTAVRRPDLIRQLVLVSGAFHHDGWVALPSNEGEMPPAIVDAYAEVSPDGREHFRVVRAKAAEAAHQGPTLTPDDLHGVANRTLVVAADDDLVHLEHTLALYRGLPRSELAVVPGTSHALLWEKPEECTRIVRSFLTDPLAPTLIPIRRAAVASPA